MKSLLKKSILGFIFFILLVFIIFLIYSSKYYKADEIANKILSENNIKIEKNTITLYPDNPSNIGIIFYPGAKVEYISYLPLLKSLTQQGYTCILAKMPFNFAFFNYNIADKIIKNNPSIKNWYMSGHSLGGAMASYYTSKNLDKINGIILLGAYVYGDIPLDKTLVIYGSNDLILNKNKLKNTTNEISIPGGNHSMFGNYGNQKNDGIANITHKQQQDITIKFITEFINKHKNIPNTKSTSKTSVFCI
ncbi:alpha/beta hydrolase [[Clostridium] colinum]|uniref:alpha/beta hydrolase n=1 Tax=[Clostridium] colinum TaxID=36835 RepID=UPI00202436F3|nr:alpha/beta hydrolase [[Clostridium] colinum]